MPQHIIFMCTKAIKLPEKCNVMKGKLHRSEVKIEIKDVAIQILDSSGISHGRAMMCYYICDLLIMAMRL